MDLAKINTLANMQAAQSSKPASSAQSLSDSLTADEQSMIDNQFPSGSNKKLELYMATGNTRTEEPAARGGNLDFRI